MVSSPGVAGKSARPIRRPVVVILATAGEFRYDGRLAPGLLLRSMGDFAQLTLEED